MSENHEIVMQAKHIVKQFPASHGRTLTACNDVNLTMYKGTDFGDCRRKWMWKVNLCPYGDFPGSANEWRSPLSWQKYHGTFKERNLGKPSESADGFSGSTGIF